MSWYENESAAGELLVKAGLITDAQLDEGSKLAGQKKKATGQMLLIAGFIYPRALQAAVDAVTMIRNHEISILRAQHCLRIASETGRSFADVVREQNTDHEDI